MYPMITFPRIIQCLNNKHQAFLCTESCILLSIWKKLYNKTTKAERLFQCPVKKTTIGIFLTLYNIVDCMCMGWQQLKRWLFQDGGPADTKKIKFPWAPEKYRLYCNLMFLKQNHSKKTGTPEKYHKFNVSSKFFCNLTVFFYCISKIGVKSVKKKHSGKLQPFTLHVKNL